MLTNGSLQGVTILKDKILEDNTGVACHPDNKTKTVKKYFKTFRQFFLIYTTVIIGYSHSLFM